MAVYVVLRAQYYMIIYFAGRVMSEVTKLNREMVRLRADNGTLKAYAKEHKAVLEHVINLLHDDRVVEAVSTIRMVVAEQATMLESV